MDDTGFDTLAKALGSLTSRRLSVGALLGGALSRLGVADSKAAKSGKCKPKCGVCEQCKKGDCDKKNGKKRCKKGKCKPRTDTGSCGTTATGEQCFCVPSGGSVRCVRAGSSSAGSGSCAVALCPAGTFCVDAIAPGSFSCHAPCGVT